MHSALIVLFFSERSGFVDLLGMAVPVFFVISISWFLGFGVWCFPLCMSFLLFDHFGFVSWTLGCSFWMLSDPFLVSTS